MQAVQFHSNNPSTQSKIPEVMSTQDKTAPSLHSQFKTLADSAAELRVLELIEQSPNVSQRKITHQAGIAAGLVHVMMRKIIAKGWVKANQVSARRWFYYLTPEGFYEKSRLTLEFLSATIGNYQKTQAMVEAHLEKLSREGARRLVVAGHNDLAHIAALNILANDALELVAVVSSHPGQNRVMGKETLPFSAVRTLIHDRALVCDTAFLDWFEENGRRKAEGDSPDSEIIPVILVGE
jgi:DNA-binding MarR family transcriptional regulator